MSLYWNRAKYLSIYSFIEKGQLWEGHTDNMLSLWFYTFKYPHKQSGVSVAWKSEHQDQTSIPVNDFWGWSFVAELVTDYFTSYLILYECRVWLRNCPHISIKAPCVLLVFVCTADPLVSTSISSFCLFAVQLRRRQVKNSQIKEKEYEWTWLSIYGWLSLFVTSDLSVKQRHRSANGTQLACCGTLAPAMSEILLA